MSKSSNKSEEIIGSKTIPPPARVNSLQALTRLRPKNDSRWCTFAFVLNRDIIKSDGTLDDLHAVVFPLGAFSEKEQSDEHAKNVIAITGHPGVISARYGAPVPLTAKFDPEAITEVRVENGKIVELENSQYKRENEEYERRMKQERELVKEAEDETDPDNIEHFKRQCFLAIKNRAAYQVHKKEMEASLANYKKREAAVRDHFARHPDHEAEWLPYFKQKLAERGEMNLYLGVETAYKEIRDELLGLKSEESQKEVDDCPNGVCLVNEDSGEDEIISAEEVK